MKSITITTITSTITTVTAKGKKKENQTGRESGRNRSVEERRKISKVEKRAKGNMSLREELRKKKGNMGLREKLRGK